MTTTGAPTVSVPAVPYRGIQPFRYADHEIFFARVRETRLLASLVDVYRGVFLYGDSGSGKSSLLNAGLLPEALQLGFEPVRVRVQPRVGEELVIEQIAISDDDSEVLPCPLAPPRDAGSRIVLSIAEFEQRVVDAAQEHQPLLLFDQFEEIVTLFEGEGAAGSRVALAEMIVRLLCEPLPIKLLFAFREDYLGRVKQMLGARPELVDQALRIGAPSPDALERIIRGPFERFPRQFPRELAPALTGRLRVALAERFGTGQVSLSEVQTVCLRLWRSPDPEALLAAKGVQGLLEDELGEALNAFPADLRAAAIALLSQMVTSAGTRNVIAAEDLRQRVAEDDADVAPALVDEALARLERESKLVRRERRRDLYLYEITSEFLVPWISRRREELRRAHERQRDRRRLRIFGSIAGGMLVLAGLVTALAVMAVNQRGDAQRRASEVTSLALAVSSGEPLGARPDVSLGLAFEAYRERQRAETRSAVVQALQRVRRSGLRAVLTGHTHLVSGVAFSPSGTILASAGDDAVRLWDPVARTERGVLRGHSAGVRAVAFSRDGRILASAGNDTTVRLWDPSTRRQLDVLTHGSAVTAVAFSPDGRTVVLADTNSVRLWDHAGRKPLRLLGRQRGRVTAVAFSPDGRTLASAGDDSRVRLWDPTTHRRLATLRHAHGTVSAVAFSPDGRIVASAGTDRTVRLWARATHKLLAVLKRHGGRVTGVAFSPDGRTLASSGDDATVRLWDRASHKQLAVLRGHVGWIYGVAFSPDGRILASAGDDKTVRTWNPSPRKQFGRLTGHKSTVRDLALSPDGKVLASAGDDGSVGVWSAVRRTRPNLLSDGPNAVYSVAFSPDGGTLASAGFAGIIRVRTLAGGKRVGSLTDDDGSVVYDVAFSPDGRTLASAHDDGTVRLWNPATGRRTAALTASDGVVNAVAFGPGGRTLVSAGSDGTLRRWDSTTRKELARVTIGAGEVTAFALSPDGRTVATATAGDATTVQLWDLATRRPLARLVGRTGPVRALAFSPTGTIVASTGDDGTVLFNPATHRQIMRLEGHAGPGTAVAFTPDAATLVTAGQDGAIRVWDEILWRGVTDLHQTVCDVLLGGLSRSEWKLYAPGIAWRRSCP